jgi:hypothetical protein
VADTAAHSDWFRPFYTVNAAVGLGLHQLPNVVGWIWLGIGVVAALGMYTMQGLVPERWDDLVAGGGRNWASLVRATWEAVLCVSLSTGLIVLFLQLFRRPRRLLAVMATASYAAYILHLVLALQAGIEGTERPSLVKFLVVAVLGTVLAFGIGYLFGRVPGLRVVLGAPKEKVASGIPAP